MHISRSRDDHARNYDGDAMTQYAAFLRGINLGKRRLKMDRLAELFEELGHKNVQTFIASGNVIFESPLDEPELVTRAEAHLRERLGYDVDVFIRSMDELREIAQREIFEATNSSEWTLYVIFLRASLEASGVEALEELQREEDRFASAGREIYWLRHGRLSDTTLTPAEASRIGDGRSSTMRNMNTVVRILDKFAAT